MLCRVQLSNKRRHQRSAASEAWHDFLDAVIVLPSGFALCPGHFPAVPVHGNDVS